MQTTRFVGEVTGRRKDGTAYRLAFSISASSLKDAQDRIEREYDWEDAISMNFRMEPAEPACGRQ